MKYKIRFIFVGLLAAMTQSSFARYYAACGTNFNPETRSFEEVKFSISSFRDVFSGRNGNATWAISLQSQTLMPEGTVLAKVKNDTITFANIHNRRPYVATEYKFGPFRNYSSETQPKLEVYEVGGFVGYAKIGSYDCFEDFGD
ncbi:MAG: hypothetical protein QE271_12310 [Bacteriovoracaceae bacterium]|nr:hypothetical protein [Bacteriovoracaceae bacterium]